MIYSVTIITCQDSKLVGLQFQVQVSFTLQNSGGDNSKMEPVFSLLPLDLHALLLPVYGVMDRHTIKLLISVDLQSSKGAMQSPSQFELVVQVQAFSPSSTASAPPPITSTTTSVSNGAPTNGETIAGSTSDDRLQTAVVVPEVKTAVPSVNNGSSVELNNATVISMTSNLPPLTVKSLETNSNGLDSQSLSLTAKSLGTDCTRHVHHHQPQNGDRGYASRHPLSKRQRVNKSGKSGGRASRANRTAKRTADRALKFSSLNSFAQNAASLTGAVQLEQDERSYEASPAAAVVLAMLHTWTRIISLPSTRWKT